MEIKSKILAGRPVLSNLLLKKGDQPVYDFVRDSLAGLNGFDGIDQRKAQLIEVIDYLLSVRFGKPGGSMAKDILRKKYFVCTADHHGPIVHPTFFNPAILNSYFLKKEGIGHYTILSSSTVSLNNHSFPRGFFFH